MKKISSLKGRGVMNHFTLHTTNINKPGSRCRWRHSGLLVATKIGWRAILLAMGMTLILPAESPALNKRIDVKNGDELVTAFTYADNHPTDFFDIYLVNPGTYKISTTLTLTRGRVRLHGSSSGPPDKYVVDGGNVMQGDFRGRVLDVDGSSGHAPYLQVLGVTIKNGYADFAAAGGGLHIVNANVQLFRSRVTENKANQPGAGIAVDGKSVVVLSSVLVDGNVNDQTRGGILATEGEPAAAAACLSGGHLARTLVTPRSQTTRPVGAAP